MAHQFTSSTASPRFLGASPLRRFPNIVALAAVAIFAICCGAYAQSKTSSLPIWFAGSTWYPVTTVNGTEVSGFRPGWKPGYTLQGDFNALFAPGAPWDPSKISVLVLDQPDIKMNPNAKQIAEWSLAHPNVKIGVVLGMLTVGPDSHCASGGGQAFPLRGTPMTKSQEGVEFHDDFDRPDANYSHQATNTLKRWQELGGRPIDLVLMDTPISAGVGKCGFTLARTVSFMLPLIQKILAVYPNIQFSLEQGSTSWTDDEFIGYGLEFFREFRRQVINPVTGKGVPVSYATLDLALAGDIRKNPTPLYTTSGVEGSVNKVAKAFSDAGVGVAVNINASRAPGETQAQVVARMHGYLLKALSSGAHFNHISIQPFAVAHDTNWVMNNLPATSPSALTWLLEQKY